MKNLKLLHTKSIYKYRRCHTQENAGFSLVEVVAVTLMIGILAAIALPSWFGFIKQQRINKANNAVLAAIQEAQQQAKKKKLSYSFSFKVESNIPKFVVHPDLEKASDIIDQPDKPKRWRNLGEDLGIKSENITLLTNLSGKNTVDSNNSAIKTNPTYLSNPQTITFDYMGTLPDANFGKPPTGSTEPPGLKIVVAASNNTIKRCVIVKTILGSTIKGRDGECD